MKKDFREWHLICLLEGFDQQVGPLDLWVDRYFRAHHALGSKDRAWIREYAYLLMRLKLRLDGDQQQGDWKTRFQSLLSQEWPHASLAHVKVSLPLLIYERFAQQLEPSQLEEVCQALLERAPTTVRVNLLKTDRQTLFLRWQEKYKVRLCQHSPWGIIFEEKVNFSSMAEFQQGLFEVQDEGSQLIAGLVKPERKESVLDFCAGSGGKSLAIAPLLQEGGKLFLYDKRQTALERAKERLARAGVKNCTFLKNPPKVPVADWVLLDAPCSGSGTYRRHPEEKWRFSQERLDQLVALQRAVFKEAFASLKPGGKIVYATCSLFEEENEAQVAFFQNAFDVKMTGQALRIWPQMGGMDGFYGAILQKSFTAGGVTPCAASYSRSKAPSYSRTTGDRP